MQQSVTRNLLILSIASLVVGCGGGGGTPTKSFSNWNSISYPSNVVADGLGYEGGYEANVDGAITSVTARQVSTAPRITLSYNSSGSLSSAVLETATSRVDANSFSYPYREYIEGTHSNEDWSIFLNPSRLGWVYQTAGIWDDDQSRRFGAMSVGAETTGSAIPTSGSATFSGLWQAFYLSELGAFADAFAGTFDADVNFSARSVSFIPTMNALSLYTGQYSSGLTPSGSLAYDSNTNNLVGTFSTDDGTMSGSAIGRFYGPDANEIGGIFDLTGSGQLMTGSFGGKR